MGVQWGPNDWGISRVFRSHGFIAGAVKTKKNRAGGVGPGREENTLQLTKGINGLPGMVAYNRRFPCSHPQSGVSGIFTKMDTEDGIREVGTYS